MPERRDLKSSVPIFKSCLFPEMALLDFSKASRETGYGLVYPGSIEDPAFLPETLKLRKAIDWELMFSMPSPHKPVVI